MRFCCLSEKICSNSTISKFVSGAKNFLNRSSSRMSSSNNVSRVSSSAAVIPSLINEILISQKERMHQLQLQQQQLQQQKLPQLAIVESVSLANLTHSGHHFDHIDESLSGLRHDHNLFNDADIVSLRHQHLLYNESNEQFQKIQQERLTTLRLLKSCDILKKKLALASIELLICCGVQRNQFSKSIIDWINNHFLSFLTWETPTLYSENSLNEFKLCLEGLVKIALR